MYDVLNLEEYHTLGRRRTIEVWNSLFGGEVEYVTVLVTVEAGAQNSNQTLQGSFDSESADHLDLNVSVRVRNPLSWQVKDEIRGARWITDSDV